jgi:hypothetical protein
MKDLKPQMKFLNECYVLGNDAYCNGSEETKKKITTLNQKIYEYATKKANQKRFNPEMWFEYYKGELSFWFDDGTISVKRIKLF